MIIIGIILSIVAIIGGIYLICYGIDDEVYIWIGVLLILFNIILLFIHLKNLGWI